MPKPSKRPYRFETWGNSILFRNVKFWTCSYCGNLIEDNVPFLIDYINGNPTPFILCTEPCLKAQTVKIEASHIERRDL